MQKYVRFNGSKNIWPIDDDEIKQLRTKGEKFEILEREEDFKVNKKDYFGSII